MMNRKEFKDLDSKSREAIILDIDKNLFVEAGAGSGKTTMLVNRMVAMVESGIDVSKISAITFTKAAANEFYERFQALLIDRSNPNYIYHKKGFAGELDEPTDLTRKRCEKALADIDLCFMGTIDSFCNMVLSEHPIDANIPTDASLITKEQETEIYKNFYVSLREGTYGEELKKISDTFASINSNPEVVFSKLIKILMDRRNINFVSHSVESYDLNLMFSKEINDLKKVFKVIDKNFDSLVINKFEGTDYQKRLLFNKHYRTVINGPKANFISYLYMLKDLYDYRLEGTCADFKFTDESVIRDASGYIIFNVHDEKDKNNPDSFRNKLLNYQYDLSLDLCLRCLPLLTELFKENGTFTFFDYIINLRDTLKADIEKGSKLINYIYNRHSYFLIDEFQDTDPIQAEIFFYLASQNPVSDYTLCKPRNGSLFIVGDPKQSIYRFRNADVSSYLKIKELFNNGVGEVLYLSNNFRSRNKIKKFFNDVFNETLKEDEDHNQSDYKDIDNIFAKEDENVFEGLYTYTSYNKKLAVEEPLMSDSYRLLEIIKSLVGNPKYKIKIKDEGLREIKFSDFMIIFSAKKNIEDTIKVFKEADIPMKVEGKVLFNSCRSLVSVINIFKALTNQKDIIALVAALKTEVFKISEADLISFDNEKGVLKLLKTNEEINHKVSDALISLNKLALKLPNHTPSTFFELIIDEYEIFKSIETDNLEILYYVLELLKNKEINGEIITYTDASLFFDELLNDASDYERCLSLKENVDAVHIANLHKVKGLEAPIVILAYAYDTNSNAELRVEYEDNETKGWILKVPKDDGFASLLENKHSYAETIAKKEKASLDAEKARLVYVAATRARNALITNITKQRGTKRNNFEPVTSRSMWKDLYPLSKDGDIFEYLGNDYIYFKKKNITLKPEDIYKEFNSFTINDSSTYKKISPSTLKSPLSHNEDEFIKEGVDEHHGDTLATVSGTMVHRLMELTLISKDSIDQDKAVSTILNEYLNDDFKEYEDFFRKMLKNVCYTIHNGGYKQINGAIDNILPVLLEADEIYAEVPFTYKEENKLLNGVIDLLYLKDFKWHIIDWKTNKKPEGLSDHYKMQLDTYKHAIKKLMGIEVYDALIYHIDLMKMEDENESD